MDQTSFLSEFIAFLIFQSQFLAGHIEKTFRAEWKFSDERRENVCVFDFGNFYPVLLHIGLARKTSWNAIGINYR